jgi:hypothetical protein
MKDYKKVPAGSIIMIAVKDDASKNLSNGVRKIIASMGSKEIYNLGFRDAFAFIGIKG